MATERQGEKEGTRAGVRVAQSRYGEHLALPPYYTHTENRRGSEVKCEGA